MQQRTTNKMHEACALASVAALVLFLFLSFVEQSIGDILTGANLKAGESWVSSAGTFAIGFHNASSPGMFHVAIWYNFVEINPKTVVWTAMVSNSSTQPLEVSKDAQLVLQKDGLVVMEGTRNAWQTTGICNECVTSAAMLESGNFVLLNNSKGVLWQSFNSPTDTLLPDQQLVGSMGLASGKYSLRMSKNQVALQFQDDLAQPYWTITNTNLNPLDPSLKIQPRLNLSSAGVVTFFDSSGGFLWKSNDSHRYPFDYGSHVIRRFTLETGGNLRMFSLAPTNDSWNIVWQAMSMECDIIGTCGSFGLCTYNSSVQVTRSCSCPPGFHAVDPKDDSAGCTYNVPLQCNNATNKLLQLDHADYPNNDYNVRAIMSIEDCKKSCLKDCKCLGAVYKFERTGLCFQRNAGQKLFNGIQSPEQTNIVFIKVSASDTSIRDPPPAAGNHHRSYFSRHLQSIIFMSIAIAEFVMFSAVGIVSCLCWRKTVRRMSNLKHQYALDVDIEGAPTRFSYEQLQVATANFSEKLGSGGFGTVYKGLLLDNNTMVAVKQITTLATQAENQFHAEVGTIGKVHHINLVRLLGYCAEGSQRLLVYEYMPNGSLEKVLGSFCCDWNTRFMIAVGIARGITYLHEECHECILHCDIKPHNVLLDENFCPKVADFGLAKLVKREHVLSVTTIRGTRGYLAPEWISNLPITAKVDVYSFGMVLLEIISGRDKFMFTSSAINSDRSYFPLWAFQKYIAADFPSIADPKLVGNVDWGQFERVLKVAFWCIQVDASSRPTMSRVVQMLEDSIEVPEPPFPRLLEDGITKLTRNPISGVLQDLSSSDVLRTGR